MGLYAKKSLGQHFLNSKHVLEQIISAAKLEKGDNVLEIGPGTGILTEVLLETGANVVTIEKDARAIGLLRTKFEVASQSGQLKVIEGDVLSQIFNVQFSTFNKNTWIPGQAGMTTSSPITPPSLQRNYEGQGNYQLPITCSYSIVANIPYYITGAILEKFLEHEPRPTKMVLLVQKEVAERICVADGKESILSISVKAFGTPKLVAKVPRGAFIPPPTVDSAILSIENISNARFLENKLDIQWFFRVVRAGFAHKRKFLIRNLEALSINIETIQNAWTELELDPKVRPEDLSVDQWIRLAATLSR